MTLTPADGPGRRDNGLACTEWGALVDVDPRLSEALLDSLRSEGVPAYVEPARDTDTVTLASTHPKRPLDRLWVDPGQETLARAVVTSEVQDLTTLLSESEPGMTAHGLVRPVPRTAARRVLTPPELPGPPPPRPSDDELFAQIVAGFDRVDDSPVPRWPVSEDLQDRGDPQDESTPQTRRRTDPVPEAVLPGWIEPAALEDDGHFEPPEAPKVPRVRLRTVLSLAMAVVGLLLVFVPQVLGASDGPGIMLIGLALLAGGAALLVWSVRDAPGHDDDGAVV